MESRRGRGEGRGGGGGGGGGWSFCTLVLDTNIYYIECVRQGLTCCLGNTLHKRDMSTLMCCLGN